MVVAQGTMLPTSAFLSAFLECLSNALDLTQQKALFLLGQGAESFKTLLLLGGKDPSKVTKLFSLLSAALPSMLKTVPHEDSDQSSLEGLTATLSCAIASKHDFICEAACLYFSDLFKQIMQLSPETPSYSKMVLSKILLLDTNFMKHCRLAVELGGDRLDYICELLYSNPPVCNLVGSHLEGVCCPRAKVVLFVSEEERLSFQSFYNRVFSECGPEVAENLIDCLVSKISSGKMEGPVTPFAAICILKAELKSPGAPGLRSDQVKNFTVSICLSVLKDKSSPPSKLMQIVSLLLEILSASYNSANQANSISMSNLQLLRPKAVDVVINPPREPLGLRIRREESLLFIDVLIGLTDIQIRTFLFRNFAHKNAEPLMVDEFISGLKRFLLKVKPHFLECVDLPLVEFLSAIVSRFSVVSKESRANLLELVMECINHPVHFREANLVLLGLVAQIEVIDIPREIVLKILKQLSKDMAQVKYNSLISGAGRFEDSTQGAAIAPTSAMKLFKAGIQLDIIKTGLESIILDPESRRNFIQLHQKLKEVLSSSPLVITVDSILAILGNRPMLDLSSQDEGNSQGGFDTSSPAKFNKYSRLPVIPADRKLGGNKSPMEGPSFFKDVNTRGYHPKPRTDAQKDTSLRNILKSLAPKGRLMSAAGPYPVRDIPVPTPHPRSATHQQNTVTNLRSSYNETRAFSGYSSQPSQMSEMARQNAKKRVLSSLHKSLTRTEEEKEAAGGGRYSPIAPLANQIPNWSDLSLVEKTRMLGEKRDYQKKIGYSAGAGNNSTFRPEINQTKADRCIFEFNSVPPLADPVPPLVSIPYHLENEDSEDVDRAIKILLNSNRRLLKVVFSELYAHRGVRGTSVPPKISSEQLERQRTLSLGSLVYFIKTVVSQIQKNPQISVLPEECKILMNRCKQTEAADGINSEELKNFLVHLADLIARKSGGLLKNTLESLEVMLDIANHTFKKSTTSQQGGDPQVIEYLMKTKPEKLPVVVCCPDLELRIREAACLRKDAYYGS